MSPAGSGGRGRGGERLAACLLALVTGLGSAIPAAAGARGPLIAAHRGGAALWPENSLGAFRNAVALGVDLIELDVHLSRDRHVVVLHDPWLERTTTGVGEVRETTLDELRGLRLKDRAGRETCETIPTLEEVLAFLAPHDVGLLLEIKNAAGRRRYRGIEEAVLQLLRSHGLTARTVVMAFDPATVRRVRELDPGTRTSLLVSRRTVERPGASPTRVVQGAARMGASDVGLLHTMLTPEVVAAARAGGLRVAAWTVNDLVGMRRAVTLGVDILITDRPDLAKELLAR